MDNGDLNNKRLNPQDLYNAALQSHNNELNIINQRNTFLIVQSILIAALATLMVNSIWFDKALIVFIWVLTLAGTIFCLLHNYTGNSGARAALRWRQYMRYIEKGGKSPLWKWRYDSIKKKIKHV
ncbi:hypothetical protein ACFLX5_05925 [Chloroflexota bacterium]